MPRTKFKRITYREEFALGNFRLRLYRKLVINEFVDPGTYASVSIRDVDENFRISITEYTPLFRVIIDLIEENKPEYDTMVLNILRNIEIVSTQPDVFLQQAVTLSCIAFVNPSVLDPESESHKEYEGLVDSLKAKWLDSIHRDAKAMEKANDEYTEEDATADAAGDAAEEELKS